jgi:DNA-binding Lrp family transcriptional regulator
MLMWDSRLTYSELAGAVGVSVQTVHRRVKALSEQGVILGFEASVSLPAVNGVWVTIFGTSKADSVEKAVAALVKDDRTDMVFTASGKMLYVHGALRRLSDLEGYTRFVQKVGSMPDAQIGIMGEVPQVPLALERPVLYPLDLKIISALKNDARRPTADLAEELGVAPRTVTRHIERLRKETLVHFGLPFRPEVTGDTFSMIHLKVRESVEKEKVALAMVKHMGSRSIISYSFGNIPDLVLCIVWTHNVKELREMCQNLESEGTFRSVDPNILLDARYCHSWLFHYADDNMKK